MFSTKESLYINAIKYDTQLKLDFKELYGDEIKKNKNYVHLVDDEILAKDIAHKINIFQENTPVTYISTLLINDKAFLVPKDKGVDLDYEVCAFNNEYNIAIAKTTLFETKHYFTKTGIDFIYSAYHLLNLHIEQNVCKNELLVFLFNNQAFLLVLDKNSSIVYSNSINLPSFENIKQSKFYEDDVLGQRLYDEIYYLELSEIIKDNLNKFYEKSKDVFVEKISILYAIKQLDSDEINSLKEELLIDVDYHPVNVDEEIFELSKDIHQKKSFIKPRKKEKSSNYLLMSLIGILLILLSLLAYNIYTTESKKENKTVKIKKEPKVVKDEKVVLPNHINLNDKIYKHTQIVLEKIPYDVVLNGFNLYKNSLKLDVKLLANDTYIKSLEPELKDIYKNISISIKDKKKKVSIDSIILANNYKENKVKYKEGKNKYIIDEFLPTQRVNEQIKTILSKNSEVKFIESKKSTYVSFIYSVKTVIDSPNEFYSIIDKLNSELYSIHLNYPIKMKKNKDKIEVEFNLLFNQPNN